MKALYLAQNGTMALVGDVDQSIYSFRHANPEGIEAFVLGHNQTHDETLAECRRCPKRVVAIADRLIRRNHPSSTAPRLSPRAENPDGIVHKIQWRTPEDEAAGLSEFVVQLVQTHGYSAGDILILTPRRLFGYAIRDQIDEANVPVHSFYNEEALEEDEAQRGFCLLKLLADNEDRVALRWWLGHGSATTRRGAYSRIRSHCEATGLSPWAAMTALSAGTLAIAGTTPLVTKFRELQTLLAGFQQFDLSALINALFPPNVEGCKVIRETALLSHENCNNVADLLKAVQSGVTQPEVPEEASFVRVMSLHKSKGLTSRVVIVAGCIQGIIPAQRPDKPPNEQLALLQEQRRLFYVAITRGTEILVLSYVQTLNRQLAYQIGAQVLGQGGQMAPAIASRFFDELGPQSPHAESGATWRQRGFAL